MKPDFSKEKVFVPVSNLKGVKAVILVKGPFDSIEDLYESIVDCEASLDSVNPFRDERLDLVKLGCDLCLDFPFYRGELNGID